MAAIIDFAEFDRLTAGAAAPPRTAAVRVAMLAVVLCSDEPGAFREAVADDLVAYLDELDQRPRGHIYPADLPDRIRAAGGL